MGVFCFSNFLTISDGLLRCIIFYLFLFVLIFLVMFDLYIMKWDVGSLWITFFIFYMFEEIIIFFFLFFINCFLYSTITFVSLSHTVFDTLPC